MAGFFQEFFTIYLYAKKKVSDFSSKLEKLHKLIKITPQCWDMKNISKNYKGILFPSIRKI
jgi:hypothetical protein